MIYYNDNNKGGSPDSNFIRKIKGNEVPSRRLTKEVTPFVGPSV